MELNNKLSYVKIPLMYSPVGHLFPDLKSVNISFVLCSILKSHIVQFVSQGLRND